MPNLAVVFKTEISRIARKELRQETDPLRKALAQQRREIAHLKREIVALAKASRETSRTVKRVTASQPANEPRALRFSSKGLHGHRTRLGLSADDLGKLLGVSGQTIYNWEQGKTSPRDAQKAAIGSLRKMGKREAAAAMAQLDKPDS